MWPLPDTGVVDGTNEGHLVTGDAERRRRFDALFAAHRLDIASYCGWRTARAPDAEDAVAEVFLVAWRRIESVPAGDAARAWLYATARRVTANQRRSRRRRDALADRLTQERLLDAPATAAASTATTSAEEATVHAALARLRDRDREVLLLVEWEGLRPAELATVLGCREVTARGRLHRARRRFRDTFEAIRGDVDSGRDGDFDGRGDLPRQRDATDPRAVAPRPPPSPWPAEAPSQSPPQVPSPSLSQAPPPSPPEAPSPSPSQPRSDAGGLAAARERRTQQLEPLTPPRIARTSTRKAPR
jgi:RNA polymerase sigma-70 factor, ECF subfamily